MSDLLVLCYHAVHPDWPATLSVRPDAFERQVTHLVERGYRGATFTDALRGTRGRRTLVVTFDDGFRSVVERAKPILDRYDLPGTLYVPTDWPGRTDPMTWPGIEQWLGTPHEPQLQSLDWDALRELTAAGWEIGSHTCSHPHLTRVTEDAELDRELVASRAVLERELDRPCSSLAYPYGDVDARVEAAAKRAGYAAACTLPPAKDPLPPPHPLQWPRMPIHRLDTRVRFGLKTSLAVRRLRASPLMAWAPARITR